MVCFQGHPIGHPITIAQLVYVYIVINPLTPSETIPARTSLPNSRATRPPRRHRPDPPHLPRRERQHLRRIRQPDGLRAGRALQLLHGARRHARVRDGLLPGRPDGRFDGRGGDVHAYRGPRGREDAEQRREEDATGAGPATGAEPGAEAGAALGELLPQPQEVFRGWEGRRVGGFAEEEGALRVGQAAETEEEEHEQEKAEAAAEAGRKLSTVVTQIWARLYSIAFRLSGSVVSGTFKYADYLRADRLHLRSMSPVVACSYVSRLPGSIPTRSWRDETASSSGL